MKASIAQAWNKSQLQFDSYEQLCLGEFQTETTHCRTNLVSLNIEASCLPLRELGCYNFYIEN